MPSLLDKVKNKLGIKKAPPGHKLGGDDYTGQQNTAGSQQKPKRGRQLSDQEKESRRDAMRAAAVNRGKAWDKKVSTSAQMRREEEKKKAQDEKEFTTEITSEETLRSVEEAKRSEKQLSESMGYNPYKPVMSSTTNTKGGSVVGNTTNNDAPKLAKNISNDSGADDNINIDDETRIQLSTALECLLNQALSGVLDCTINSIFKEFENPEDIAILNQGILCINTAVKMLHNLSNNAEEAKFRSIRLNNKNFSNKVAEVEGGLELMMCAGFAPIEVDEEAAAGGEGSMAGMYLKHKGVEDESSMELLHFTLSRLQHVQSLL